MHVHFWPGSDVAISGLRQKVTSATVLKTGQQLTVSQDGFRTLITGLPQKAPASPVTTLVLECDDVPVQDVIYVRTDKPRAGIGI
jgi:alpha-L-fucosidase